MGGGQLPTGWGVFARDILFEPMSDGRSAFRGREAVEAQMREFLAQWSAFRIEAQEFTELGDAVLVVERQHGKGKSSGIEIDTTFYAVWIFRGGLVVRVLWETDRAKALAAAGLRE